MSSERDRRHRVVIVGGGFGGVQVARKLRGADVEITLIDRTNHHLFQPLLYQVATGVLSPGQIAPPLRSLFRDRENVRVLMAEVREFNLEERVVHADFDGPIEVPYDTLIVAAGATHSYFGHDEWSTVAPGMKSLDDAARIRSRVLGAFEIAEQARTTADRDAWLTFVVVGAGPTGVELAGQLAILSRRVLRGEYRSIDPALARIVLLDAAPAVLPSFPPRLQAKAADDLRRLGVDVELDAPVTGLDAAGVDVGDEHPQRITARTILWAAGVQASELSAALANASGAEVDRSGRIVVSPDLSLPRHLNVFVIGDMAHVDDVPGVAPAAMQQGRYVAAVVGARLRGRPAPVAFAYRDRGSMAIIGRGHAVARTRRLQLSGVVALLMWAAVHLAYLVGWGNRFGAVARWSWTIVARNRRERLISVASLGTEQYAQSPQDD
jgi:NADH:ubiquinone reductase (H+-translocating)